MGFFSSFFNKGSAGHFDNAQQHLKDAGNACSDGVVHATKAGHASLQVGVQALAGVASYEYLAGKIMTTYSGQKFMPKWEQDSFLGKAVSSAASILFYYPAQAFVGTIIAGILIHPVSMIEAIKNTTLTVVDALKAVGHTALFGLETMVAGALCAEEVVETAAGAALDYIGEHVALDFSDIDLSGASDNFEFIS